MSETHDAVQEPTDPSPRPENDPALAILCDACLECGIQHLEIAYDGCGDSGSVEDIAWSPNEINDLPQWLYDRLEELAWEYTPQGFENNEGGYGRLEIDCERGIAQLRHTARMEETESMDASSGTLSEALRKQLIELGAQLVDAEFDGSGDSGAIEDLYPTPETVVIPESVQEAIRDELYGHLGGGWEINDGSFGTFTIDVGTGMITGEGHWRITVDDVDEKRCWRFR